MPKQLLDCRLLKTKQRLTFEIIYQAKEVTYQGDDDGPYFTFTESNGYEVISRSRMDIQTERIWLAGALPVERSGTMIFSSDEKRDVAFDRFVEALKQWAEHYNGDILIRTIDGGVIEHYAEGQLDC